MRRIFLPRLPLLPTLLLAFCVCAPAVSPAFGQAEPPAPRPRISIDLGANALRISGVSPSGPVAWLGVQRAVDSDFSVARSTRAGVVLAGADGTARIDFETPLARRAIWVVVDVASGEHGTATPAGFPLRLAEDGHSRLSAGEGGAEDALLEDRPEIAGLMVRPGVGAWRFAAADGGGGDDDGRSDGSLRVPLPHLEPLEGSPAPPAKLGSGDLWFVIDPLVLDLALLAGPPASAEDEVKP